MKVPIGNYFAYMCIGRDQWIYETMSVWRWRILVTEKSCPTEVTFYFLENMCTETETIKIDADHLYGAKVSMSHKRVSSKIVGSVLSHSITVTKKL